MAFHVLGTAPVDVAFCAMLRAGTGFQVGEGRTINPWPVDANGDKLPYYVVDYIDGGAEDDGPAFEDPTADATVAYQVQSVGCTVNQARAAADRVRDVITRRADKTAANDGYVVPMPPTPGISVVGRVLYGTRGGLDSAGQEPNLVFTVTERFLVTLTPSS